MYTNIFSFGERILPEYHTHDVMLSNNMARPMKLRCCVFNKVFLVNHWYDILHCSYKWLCFSNSYKWKYPKNMTCFPLTEALVYDTHKYIVCIIIAIKKTF